MDVAGLFNDVPALLADAPTAVNTCKGMKPDINRIKAWASMFTDPVAVEAMVKKNIETHPIQVAKDVSKLKSDVSGDDWTDAGVEASDLFTIALGKIPAASEMQAYHHRHSSH